MSFDPSADTEPTQKSARPSWEMPTETSRPAAPARQNPAARPPMPPQQTAPPPASPAPPYYAAPPASPPGYAPPEATSVEYDLAGNTLPQSGPAPPVPQAYPAGQAAPSAGVWPPAPSAARVYVAQSDRIAPEKMLLGILLGLGIGIVGGILIEKILFYAHFGLSLLYIAMGYGIGWGIHRVTGRGGPGLAMLAVGLMVACLGVSHLVWTQDVLSEARRLGDADPGVTVLEAFPIAVGHLGFMHWVCIAFGLLACYRGVEQQSH